jgi:hypothetical protein
VQQANLSLSLLFGAGSLNNTQTVSLNGSQGWNAAGQTIGTDGGNTTYYALSIKADGSLVEVSADGRYPTDLASGSTL